ECSAVVSRRQESDTVLPSVRRLDPPACCLPSPEHGFHEAQTGEVMITRRRVLIIGGVAGGASCAARLRRLDEAAEIVVFDRGPFFSFAYCGLPYYVGNVIEDERALLVASPEMFRQRFNIEVHTNTEVVGI